MNTVARATLRYLVFLAAISALYMFEPQHIADLPKWPDRMWIAALALISSAYFFACGLELRK